MNIADGLIVAVVATTLAFLLGLAVGSLLEEADR